MDPTRIQIMDIETGKTLCFCARELVTFDRRHAYVIVEGGTYAIPKSQVLLLWWP